ncbi:hypothetical protein BDZ97DRAFT_1839815 [Flammula alnicola]|nr:hypothetical protein BDZ97DRAFT_1839815 [Flammula alnicola]
MSESAVAGTKRKKPPTFQHLPVHRAKTLKKAWVEKTKIKSKWKAQKRKEGLASSSRLEMPVYADEQRHDSGNKPKDDKDGSESDEEDYEAAQETLPRTAKQTNAQAPHMHPSRAHIHPDVPVKRLASPKREVHDSRPTKKQKTSEEEAEPADPVSLRELTREAYSRSTLHTYRADPLKKHKFTSERGGRGGGRGRGRGRGGRPETGRGQPNMKLRMNAMLAKIKQDFA